MTKKFNSIKTLIIIIFCLATAGSMPFFVFGQDYKNEIINKEIKEINSDINNKKSEIKKIQKKQLEYSAKIKQKQSEKSTLNNQLAILDNRIAKAELDIELIETDIKKTELEIQKTDIEIEDKNKDIKKEKKHIADIMRLMHKKDNITSLEILLLNDSLADFLSQVKYLENVNEEIEKSIKELKKTTRLLNKEKDSLNNQNKELEDLKIELNDKKKKFFSEKDSKINILNQVATSENEYQRLLKLAKKEQENAAYEIVTMEKQARLKMAELEGKKLEFNDDGLIWPVPKNVITAYFHDPDYPFRYIFEHPGVDIRASQGTPIKAVASGYVARVKHDNSSRYGYIMIVHGDGLSTVYGHISKVYVKEDDYVVQGQKIALSGGLPGTPGAGRLTTGPHLHFEVRLNGIPVDPLGGYLK